jgi:mRNA interferase HicA
MKASEMKRLLRSFGARFKEGAKHTKVYLNGKQSTLPRHGSHEIGEGLKKEIFKQLGIREPPR